MLPVLAPDSFLISSIVVSVNPLLAKQASAASRIACLLDSVVVLCPESPMTMMQTSLFSLYSLPDNVCRLYHTLDQNTILEYNSSDECLCIHSSHSVPVLFLTARACGARQGEWCGGVGRFGGLRPPNLPTPPHHSPQRLEEKL